MDDINKSTLAKFTIKTINDKDKISNYLIPNLPNIACISDNRKTGDLKLVTIGNFPRAKVASALDKAISQQKIEEAIHWAFQLLGSGVITPLWDKLLNYGSKYINIYNPSLPVWLASKNEIWHHITSDKKYTKENILLLRNHPSIRNLLTETIVILAQSNPRKMEVLPKITGTDFIVTNFQARQEANSNSEFSKDNIKNEDPKEIRVAANEFAYQLFYGNLVKSLYWLSWLMTWESINIKKYGKYDCASRGGPRVPIKTQTNVIWLIWDLVKNIKNRKHPVNGKLDQQFNALWELFTKDFTVGSRGKKMPYLIWAMDYIIHPIDWNTKLINNEIILFQSLLKNDKIMGKIQKNIVVNGGVNNSHIAGSDHGESMIKPTESIVINNYQVTEVDRKKQEEIKKKKMEEVEAQKKKISLDSLQKIKAMNQIDKYVETTIFY